MGGCGWLSLVKQIPLNSLQENTLHYTQFYVDRLATCTSVQSHTYQHFKADWHAGITGHLPPENRGVMPMRRGALRMGCIGVHACGLLAEYVGGSSYAAEVP